MAGFLAFFLTIIILHLTTKIFSFSHHIDVFKITGSIKMSTVEDSMKVKECPDFYWQYRLDRLVSKKGADLSFSASSYPDVSGAKNLYDAYYLDLTLSGKLAGFDWMAEKDISDAEWMSIYRSICQWSAATAKANKPSTSNLASNDFDLLKQFYPQLNFRELETSFVPDEVGNNFPYKNMKEMLGAAMAGKLNVPGYSAASVTSLEATEVRASLKTLESATMKKIDTVYEDAMKYATNPFPDDAAKKHYQALRTKLADFPQGAAGWATYRANMEREVDEMAKLASKKEDEHHHHGDEEHGHKEPSPAEQFQAKYGKSLDEMQERMAKYKSDPEKFLEASIMEKYGKNGLDIWKKSQEFSANMNVMSDADKAAAEKSFADFLKQA